MKKCFLILLVVVVGLSLTGVVSAADKDAIKAQVDEIAIAIEGGKPVSDFADAAKRDTPLCFHYRGKWENIGSPQAGWRKSKREGCTGL